MGYFEVLDELERLSKHNKEVTVKDLMLNMNSSEQSISRTLSMLVKDGRVKRRLVYEHNGKNGKRCFYSLNKGEEIGGFINGVFKAVADLIR